MVGVFKSDSCVEGHNKQKDAYINNVWKTPGKMNVISVKKQVGRLGVYLRSCMLRRWPKEHFVRFCRDVELFLPQSSVGLDQILYCWVFPGDGALSQDSKARFFFAVMYYISAKNLAKIDELEGASFMAMQSIYELGYNDGFHDYIDAAGVEVRGPIAGGRRWEQIRTAVERRLIELIGVAPIESIKSQSKAHGYLASDLRDFVLENGYEKIIDADSFIAGKLKGRGDVKNAYLSRLGKL